MWEYTTPSHGLPIGAFFRGESARNAYRKNDDYSITKGPATVVLSITVAGPLLTEKTSLILYVLRTCPARIRPGKRHELPIKEYNVTHNYFQIGWRNCNVRGRPIEFYLFPSRLCVHVNHNRK